MQGAGARRAFERVKARDVVQRWGVVVYKSVCEELGRDGAAGKAALWWPGPLCR